MDKQSRLSIEVCSRCGVQAIANGSADSEALILKRAASSTGGLCASCAITEFIKHNPSLMQGISIHGPEMLLNPMIQKGFIRLLRVANSDATPSEIDWQRVVDNWDLPIP